MTIQIQRLVLIGTRQMEYGAGSRKQESGSISGEQQMGSREQRPKVTGQKTGIRGQGAVSGEQGV